MALLLQSCKISVKQCYSAISNILSQVSPCTALFVPSRTTGQYTDWRMLRDVKRRKMVKEHAKLRLQINAMRKNDILPSQIREIADHEIAALPHDTSISRLHGRCVITSRARGKLTRWRMSRIVWRHLADYNYLSGVQRSRW